MYAHAAFPYEAPCHRAPSHGAHSVREHTGEYRARFGGYESEGSEQRSLGSISVAADARWLATLTVPILSGRVAFFHLERRGALPPGYRGSEEEGSFSVPLDEVDSVLAILNGIVTQAREDRVLPPGEGR